MDSETEVSKTVTSKETWMRGLYILLFAIISKVARFVVVIVVLGQFLFTLFSGKTNSDLKQFGDRLSRYIYQILQYVTYNSDTRPFPFSPWPSGPESESESESESKPDKE